MKAFLFSLWIWSSLTSVILNFHKNPRLIQFTPKLVWLFVLKTIILHGMKPNVMALSFTNWVNIFRVNNTELSQLFLKLTSDAAFENYMVHPSSSSDLDKLTELWSPVSVGWGLGTSSELWTTITGSISCGDVPTKKRKAWHKQPL